MAGSPTPAPLDKTWQKNAGSQIFLDSIYAVLAGVWITVVMQDGPAVSAAFRFSEVCLSVFAFFLFAISAEGTTTAYDEKDTLKFVYYLLWYNIGVVLIGAAIWLFILQRFWLYFVHFTRSRCVSLSPGGAACVVIATNLILFITLLWRWIDDARWLLLGGRADFDDYVKELNDDAPSKLDRRLLMRIVFRHRLR